jgi:hypothetical protein
VPKSWAAFVPLVAAVGWIAPDGAAAETIRAGYGVSIRGFPVGSASLTAEIAGGRYSIAFSGGVRGLARLFSDAKTTAKVNGRIGTDRLEAETYSHLWTEDGETERVAMRFVKRGVAWIEAPGRKHPERYVPLTPATNADALDLLSAFLWPVAAFEPKLCDRTMPLIDGRRRFDIALSFSRQESFTVGAETGNAIVCSFRYRPVAGQRIGAKNDASITDSDDAEVWMAPAGEELVVPVRLQFRTRAGRIVLKATDIAAD